MIEVARTHAARLGLENAVFFVQEGETLSLPDETFTVVTSKAAFHHMENHDRVFSESFGSVLAFEYSRRLRREHGLTPQHLVLNAYGHLATRRTRLLHVLPDDEFVRTLAERYGGLEPAVVNDRAMLAMVLPIVRADL